MGIDRKKRNKNYAWQFVAVMVISLIISTLMYWLPSHILQFKVKKVDMLSDLRKPAADVGTEDLMAALNDDADEETAEPEVAEKEQVEAKNEPVARLQSSDVNPAVRVPETPHQKPAPPDTVIPKVKQPKTTAEPKNSPVTEQKTNQASKKTTTESKVQKVTTDYLSNTNIEDFTMGRTGLRRFFAALNNIANLRRPVRIAFLGDSFIEGDIMVADFRQKMQAHFGGRGVGFIPITSNVAQYRPTIKQSAEGWRTYSIIKDKSHKYVLSGLLFEPDASVASVDFQTVDMYTRLQEVSSLKFIYAANDKTDITVKSGAEEEIYELPPSDAVTQFELKGTFTKGTLIFKRPQGLKAIGLALEDNRGIIVDNFSLRGNSGIVMSELDAGSCRELQQVRPYDLIVLQYGLNVASESVQDYGWYRKRMLEVIDHIQYCFPGADIMVLGVSDRSYKNGNAYSTMPAVLSLLKAQRQTAKEAEVTFWSIFAAMGGQNSMVKYVKSNWASKDYTHLSFRGGREVADAFYDALLTEKGMYDGEERLVER